MNQPTIFYPFAGLLTDRSRQTLASLLQLTRGGRMSPLAADFNRLTAANASSNFGLDNILGQILDHNYQFRHELLLDLVGFLFWQGRFAWRARRPAAIPWGRVRANRHRYWLPDHDRINVTRKLPSIQLMCHTHDILVPHRDCEIEDAVFVSVLDIMCRLPVEDRLTDFPQISLDKLCNERRETRMVFVSGSGNGDPIFADEEINNCSHHDCYCESLLRFAILLMNQCFWCSGCVSARKLFELKPKDRIIVCANELNADVFDNDRSEPGAEIDQARNVHYIHMQS